MKKKKFKSPTKKMTQSQLQQSIYFLLTKNATKVYNPKQIVKRLKIKNSKDSIVDALQFLVQRNKIAELGDYKYKAMGNRRSAGLLSASLQIRAPVRRQIHPR